jgi:hypothetical protein
VVLAPAVAAVGDAITCDVRTQRDVDGEPVAVAYRWYRDGRLDGLAEDSATLPAGTVRRDERWRCETWASDGHAVSPRATAELTVRNTPPSAPQVVIEPARARRPDDLYCRVAVAAADADADPVTYTYAWWRDERPVSPGSDPSRIEASRLAKGERWRCAATPSDGTAAGPAGGADRTVSPSPPGPARVRLVPAAPRPGEVLRCEVTGKSDDVDGDAVSYRHAWLRNGTPQPFAETSQEVPARLVKAGDRWRCVITPTDGTDDGPPAGTEEALVGPEQGVGLSVVGRP